MFSTEAENIWGPDTVLVNGARGAVCCLLRSLLLPPTVSSCSHTVTYPHLSHFGNRPGEPVG